MTLYLIGIGLSSQKDITVRGLEAVRSSDIIYLENYTSLLSCSKEDLERFYEKKIVLADRSASEEGDERIVEQARDKIVTFLVIGDPLSATTHIDLFKLAKEKGVTVEVIHNASVFTAIGDSGLQIYKFGRTASVPFLEDVPGLEAPYSLLRENHLLGMHTLFLLDLKPQLNKFMTVNEALGILQSIEEKKQERVVKDTMLVVGCARLGSTSQEIKAGKLKDLLKHDFGAPPHCLIIPGRLHFIEEEMLELWGWKK